VARLLAGTATLTGAVVVRQLAEQPTFIAGPLCLSPNMINLDNYTKNEMKIEIK
jgi:hypothetical protein